MKTIGDLLKETRVAKGISRNELSEVTHIKVSFIFALENGEWNNLPEFSTTIGFVKSISHFLDMDENQAVSTFRRDYPPKLANSLGHTPQPPRKEIRKKVSWGPRLTFFVGILVIVLVVLGYLGIQYRKFNMPPTLIIYEPTEGQTVSTSSLEVKGKTETDATVSVNNQPAIVDTNGNFDTKIDTSNKVDKIVITARSRSGKETTISRTIKIAL